MRRLLVISVMLLCFAGLDAQDLSSRRVARQSSVLLGTDVPESVAAYLYGPWASFTEARVSLEGRDEKAPEFIQEGNGENLGVLDIRTLVRMDSLSAVRGSVRYSNGTRRNVCWNSSSDFRLLYPYVMADSIGGNLSREQYEFSGSYATRKGRWHYGLGAQYRALHEFRQIDPRPRNIVSDLSASASAGYQFGGSVLDLTVSYRKYTQSQRVGFFNVRGANTAEFHFTGLGSHYSRYAGASSSLLETRYEGEGFSLMANLFPEKVYGFRATLGGSVLNIIHSLPNQTDVPYNYLYTRTLNAAVGYAGRNGGLSYRGEIYGNLEDRDGTESVVDNAAGGNYEELIHFKMYSATSVEGGFRGAVELARPYGTWTLVPAAAYEKFNSEYEYPYRKMTFSDFKASLEAGFMRDWKSWLFSASMAGALSRSLSDGLELPEEYTIPEIKSAYEDLFARHTMDLRSAGLRLYAEKMLSKRFSLGLDASCRRLFLSGAGNSDYYKLSISINF